MLNLKEFSRNIKKNSLNMVHKSNASHIGSALSVCDIVAVLYGDILNVDPENPVLPDRDRFILSKGHACVAVYSALAIRGFFPIEDLDSYAADHSILMTHISHKVQGVEFSSGSLGHGLPVGVGKCVAAKKSRQDWRTFVLLSDGELGEGSNWEAMMFAAHHCLDNLVAIIDYNKLQSLTTVDQTVRVEPLADKAIAFGWAVREVDGHDHAALQDALASVPWEVGKPSFLIAHTVKGKGVSFMENRVEWHYKSPSTDQLGQALGELDNA
ncbi:transketolase [Rhodobacterales bacterium HKCCA1058]|nr:transketolase [Rhodobacterales bacterium HKCCA1058]